MFQTIFKFCKLSKRKTQEACLCKTHERQKDKKRSQNTVNRGENSIKSALPLTMIPTGRKNGSTALVLMALIFSSHCISVVFSCSNSGCSGAVLAFINLLRIFPSPFISFSTAKIMQAKAELIPWYVNCEQNLNCSYVCDLNQIWYDLWDLSDPGNSTYDSPFPDLLYGVCQFQGGVNYTQCTTPSSAFCLSGLGRRETEADLTRTLPKTTTTNDEIIPRGEYSEYGSCSVGAVANCSGSAPCCNHALGGQGFLCIISCASDEPSLYDCLNGAISNYCHCLGTC